MARSFSGHTSQLRRLKRRAVLARGKRQGTVEDPGRTGDADGDVINQRELTLSGTAGYVGLYPAKSVLLRVCN